MDYKYLFTPLKVGPVTIKNRIVSPAHGTLFSRDEMIDERFIEYQRARAKGGVGLIISGAMCVMPNSNPFPHVATIYDQRVVPMLRRLAEAVHPFGAKIFQQINHHGRQMESGLSRQPIWGPSAIPCPVMREMPKEMEIEDIKEAVMAFAKSARLVKEGGLDGVEIHGASGYLIGEFMSPWSNKRRDEYGGSLENRLKFPLEVIDAIRKTVGNDFVVGIRVAGDEMVPGGNTLEDMAEIIQRIEATGKIDYISIGIPPYQTFYSMGTGMQLPLGFNNAFGARFKEVVDLPILTVGRINDPVQAEKILADGQADMVGMVRALIADPELPNKAREGRLDEIRTCIADNQGCFGRIFKGLPMGCLQNAAVGQEKEIGTLEAAKNKKKVLVVGGGPGGMEAARVARLRGHEVVLYEKEKELGGQVNLAMKVPSREEFGGCARHLIKEMELLGVRVNLGVEVTPELISREKPDAVVVATGSTPSRPSFPGVEQENVVTVRDVLQGKGETGEKVVVVDGGEAHWQSCSIAEYLAGKGKKVEIITYLTFVGMDLAPTTDLTAYYMRVQPKGVVFTPNTALRAISGKTVTVLDIHTQVERKIEGVDTVVLAAGSCANNQLYRNLKGKVKEVHAVGDCVAPRKAIDAIYEGYNIGRII